MAELKPCPFCGVYPVLRWEPWSEISETSGAYVIEAEHDSGCFIRRMNGTNLKGQMTAFNQDVLIKAWNRRANDAEVH